MLSERTMHIWSVLLWVMYCLAVVVVVPMVCSVDEVALIALKSHITSDPQGILATNWTTESPHCSWYGITCFKADPHQESRVSGINMSNMGLQGSIPPEIGNLSFLVSLDLSNNSFHATIPQDMGKCKELQQLNLWDNKLVGRIPESIGNLSKLEELNLGNNQLTGDIAATIFNISSLLSINLSHNRLSGSLPMHMCYDINPKVLKELNLSSNHLSGNIPTGLSQCTKLQVISLSHNRFTGIIPSGIGNLVQLQKLSLWNNSLTGEIPSSLSHCQQLQLLSLSYNQLKGDIPQAIGSLSNLQKLYLGWNNLMLSGIPKEIGNLSNLNTLSFPSCGIGGTIPTQIFNISLLQVIDLSNNSLSGSLPVDACKHLPNLQWLYLDSNNLSGELPATLSLCGELLELGLSGNKFTGSILRGIGNLSKLELIDLGTNDLQGLVPTSFGNLKVLRMLSLETNNFTGMVPEAIFNLSNLQTLALYQNHLSGNLPSSIGTTLPNLKGLLIGANHFSGTIPKSVSNMSQLITIDIGGNSFTGNVPEDLGNLSKLERLVIWGNQLSNEKLASEIGFLTSLSNCKFLTTLWIANNPFKGTFPNSLGRLPVALEILVASNCQFGGAIPLGIGNLSNLIRLDLEGNHLTGPIPSTLGRLRKLQVLSIEGNRIHGSIPCDLCHLKNLGSLSFSSNKLSGSIPSCFEDLYMLRYLLLNSNVLRSTIPSTLWTLKGLLVLDLSSNFLTGNLPLDEVGNMKSILRFDMSKNLLSGYIPSSIGELQNLANLDFSHNRLQGPIPAEFGNLVSLKSLDLSHNNLSGTIPKTLEALIYLSHLNVSFNQLQGEIPDGGPFSNFTAESFIFNKALCGASHFHVSACHKHTHNQFWKYILLPVASILILAAILIHWVHKLYNSKSPTLVDSWLPGTHTKISHQQLLHATNHFSEENLIGKGSMCMVYKGVLPNGLVVAIKVFNLDIQGALRSFDSESQVMKKIRHRNLIKIITCYSNLDFKALVLEYMPNGSLEKWLYSHDYFLDLIQRLNIMIDVASALEYLQHGISSLVVHCDLKPSNVLLDDDMIAHVADFGIARLFGETEQMQQTRTLGTIGYMAPEYGSNGIVSAKGDVYSYGILLMEVFTRKKPMDEMFSGDLTLKNWVESLSSSVTDIVDANLFKREEDGEELTAIKLSCLSSIMVVALACTTDSPWERMEMKDVVFQLKKIRIKLLV